jgi:hypothetical protein
MPAGAIKVSIDPKDYPPYLPVITTAPVPTTVSIVGPEMIPGSGRCYVMPFPIGTFQNGEVITQGGNHYKIVINQTPFGPQSEADLLPSTAIS